MEMKLHSSKLAFAITSIIISITLLTNSLNVANASQNSEFKLSQNLKQHNLCAEHSECSNLGFNTADMIKNLKQKIFSRVNQQLKQHNLCIDSECINEGYNQLTLDKLKEKFNQKIEQTNECENSECINEGANEITGSGNANSKQTIVQTNECASGATCINSAGNVYLIGNTPTT